MSRRYDAIVVGGGSVGVPSAYYLAQRGLKVLVLDRRPAVGQGDNKAAIGGIRATHSDPAKILLCSRGLEEMSTWKERHGVDVGWKPGGYAFPVYGQALEETLRGLFPIQHQFQLEIDWIDAEAMAELVPGIVREGLRGGTYSPNDGQLSPLKVPVAFQPFQHGTMVWRSDTREIYVLHGDGAWAAHDDAWTSDEPEWDSSISAPEGLIQPKRGFGKVWREHPELRDGLGWGLTEEEGGTAIIHAFERGIMLSVGQDTFVLVVRNDGTPVSWFKP